MSISNLQNYLWNGVDGYVYDPSPDRIYVSSFSSHEVLEIDPSNGQITARIPSERFPFKSILVNQELLTFSLWESTPSYILEKDVQPWIFFLTCPPTIARNTWHQTNTLLVGGLNVETPVSVPNIYNVEIWKNGVNVGQSTTVINDDTIYLRLLTPSQPNEKIELPLFIGEGYHYFTSTTVEVDSAVNPFEFDDILGANINEEYTSNTITVSSIDSDVSITATASNGTLIKNGIDILSNTTSVVNGDTLAVKLNSSSLYSTPVFSRVEFGTQYSVWTVLTKLDPDDVEPLPTPQNFDSILNADLDTEYQANSYGMLDALDLYLEPVIGAEIIANGTPVGQIYSASVGDIISIKTKSSQYNNTARTIKLVGRGYLSEFTIETLADTSIDYLTFHTNHYVPLKGRTTSNPLTVSGLSVGESVELELVPDGVFDSYIYNTMDVRFDKNAVDTVSKYVTVSNGDTLNVSAYVTGASWNGFVQEFKIFAVQRIYDPETNELLEIQRVSEVGFWRYVTAYLVGPFVNKQKEIPINIAQDYAIVATYNNIVEITQEGIKPFISSHEIDFSCVISHTHFIELPSEYIQSGINRREVSVTYEAERVYHNTISVEILPTIDTRKSIQISRDCELSTKTQKSINVDYIDIHGHKSEVDILGYEQIHGHKESTEVSYERIPEKHIFVQGTSPVVSGVTKATQDVSYIPVFRNESTGEMGYERIPEKHIFVQGTSPVVSGVTKATQDVDFEHTHKTARNVDLDYFKVTKNTVLADPITGPLSPVHFQNFSNHSLGNSAQPELAVRCNLNIERSVDIIHKGNYQDTISTGIIKTSAIFRYLDADYSEIKNLSVKSEFSADVSVVTRSDRSYGTEYLKERYYHFNTIDTDYSFGIVGKLIEFENPYQFHHATGNWTSTEVGYDTEKFGVIGDTLVDHAYEKSGFSSNLSAEAQYYVTEHYGEKLFEASASVSNRTSKEFELGVSRRSIQAYTLDVEYSTPGRTIRELSSSHVVRTYGEEINIATQYLINNAHTAQECSVAYEHKSITQRVVEAETILSRGATVALVERNVEFNNSGKQFAISVDYEAGVNGTNAEISRTGVSYIGTRAKSVEFNAPIRNSNTSIFALSREVEVNYQVSHGETNYTTEEFRAFDTEAEAIAYAESLGTILNPKAMRLVDGRWFYYGDSNEQNAHCKISFNYPTYGWVSGG